MTDTPPPGDDDLLKAAAEAPAARQHRSHRSRRRRGLRPIDIAGIVVAVLVVIGVVVVIAKGHKSSTTSAATTTTATNSTGSTVAGAGPNATTWTFTTLDGKTITVSKGLKGSVRFAVYKGNSLPLTIIGVDRGLAKNDCAAVQKIYVANSAANPTSSPGSTARRSAYAHYALVQAAAHNCAWAKATTTTT